MQAIRYLLSILLFASGLATPLACFAAGEQLVPAGSLIQCTVSEPRLSFKTAAIGDPVLCQVDRMERYGGSMLPYGSYLEGRFEDYRDPGRLIGKGWMQLVFDRMVIEPDTVIPLSAKVVAVPDYNVDRDGCILGKGHAVRDTVEWMIPILLPIDLINLPRRVPRPTWKEETRLTLKVMDDFGIPSFEEPARKPSGLAHRPAEYTAPLTPPAAQTIVYNSPPAVAYFQPPAPNVPAPYVLIMRNGLDYKEYLSR